MRLTSTTASLESITATWIAYGIYEGESVPAEYPCADLVSRLIAAKDATGSLGQTIPLYERGPNGASVLVFGLGKPAKFDAGEAFAAGVAVAKRLASKPKEKVAVLVPSSEKEDSRIISAIVEGLIVGTSSSGIRKKEPNRTPFEHLEIVAVAGEAPVGDGLEKAVRRGEIVGNAVNLARELVNLPPSEKPPIVLAEKARQIAEKVGLGVEVWDRDRLKAERFGGVLAVASGSDQPPAFVALTHRMGGEKPTVALVGKGVTFDSGGLSLKPSASMEDMKCDMAGAAVVLAVMQTIARLKIPANVVGYFALTENMTGGDAMKLGDVLTMRNGTTVEVLNTDAEGRLILADVLSYAVESKPAYMIDLATLTGACLVALGTKIAGLFTNNPPLAELVRAAGEQTGERTWRMPMDDDFDELIKSKVADIRNVGGKWGGAISAAKFLERFVGETPWVHLDIAGPAWSDEDTSTRDSGGTGAFVRTLVTLIEREATRL